MTSYNCIFHVLCWGCQVPPRSSFVLSKATPKSLISRVVVSWNRGTPQIIHFNGIFPFKPTILGYPHGHGNPPEEEPILNDCGVRDGLRPLILRKSLHFKMFKLREMETKTSNRENWPFNHVHDPHLNPYPRLLKAGTAWWSSNPQVEPYVKNINILSTVWGLE